MAHRWWKIGHLQMEQEVKERVDLRYEPRWRHKMLINAGAACTAIVMLVFAATKFTEGAWIVLLLMPILVECFRVFITTTWTLPPASRSNAMASRRVLRQCVIIPLMASIAALEAYAMRARL
jgi:hypothetical protein